MTKMDACPMHCPKWSAWLWTLLAAWFVLAAFGVPTFGLKFWSLVALLAGACTWACAASTSHGRSGCPMHVPIWLGVLSTLVGAWFVLADLGWLSTYGINLLHAAALLVGLWLVSQE